MRPARVIGTVVLLMCAGGFPRLADAQTFAQLTDLGDQIGPRLTRGVTQARINRMVFGATKGKVTYIDLTTFYQFTADPVWKRVIVWKKDTWTHAFTNETGPGGGLSDPGGIDISARRKFYLADRGNGWILYATFDPAVGNIVNAAAFRGWLFDMPYLKQPVDVAWDGQISPLTTDFIYVLDRQNSVVSYWNLNNAPADYPDWAYGEIGTGTGQFRDPTSVCVGKTPSSSGGTQFTANFYVVDNGNNRLVWLNRGGSGASWQTIASLANWDPVDCAVDHFGNVYVADRANHRIHKFTSGLTWLASYGSYGVGTTLNTFNFPHAISVPCGLKVVNSQTVWYCEGRVVTAEDWGDQSGALEHYLGIQGSITAQPQPDAYNHGATFGYFTTDHATHGLVVWGPGGEAVRRSSLGLKPPGGHTGFWNGYTDAGTSAPTGNYTISITLNSAYSCSGQSWCATGISFQSFFHQQEAPPPPCETPPCPFSPPITDPSTEPEPATLFFRQRVVADPRPLARVTGQQAIAAAPLAAQPGALSELVRELGVRGVTFSVTRQLSSGPIKISVHSLSGRRVRVLVNEVLAPGVYEIGWDGLDDRGRPAAPGVYFAVLTAGGSRLVQRLIIR